MAHFVALGSSPTLFQDPDTDPHQSEKLYPEPHQSQNSRAVGTLNVTLEGPVNQWLQIRITLMKSMGTGSGSLFSL
jgi:hypothetical protein